MSNTKFFNDAVAEAKEIRETALANAKLALEEAFTPQIQSMLEKKLQEESEDLDEEKAKDDMDEAKHDTDENTVKEDARTDAEEEGYEDGIKDAKADAKKAIDDIKLEEKEKELKEAYATVKALKNELNEINVLNAKLLYTNKIFKSKNLSENNKVKVLTSFDKAETVKEAKLIYETLKDGLTDKKVKKTVNESIGMASKAIGKGPKKVESKPIVESNQMVDRFKKLAGIT